MHPVIERINNTFKNHQFIEDKNVILSENKDIKLSADLKIEEICIKTISTLSPYSILSEEKGYLKHNCDNTYLWVIDPLDGTMNYYRNFPLYGISISLLKYNLPLLGYILHIPEKKAYYCDENGAYYENKAINVSSNNINQSVLCTGFPTYMDFSENTLLKMVKRLAPFKKIRMIGSAAMSLAYVASGVFDAYYEEQIKIWDVAAGLALVKAAGGKYIMKPGDSEHSYIVAATNGKIDPNIFF